MKHNYIPLVTYRGWDKRKQEWIYGSLVKLYPKSTGFVKSFIIDMSENKHSVEPNSLGIYKGQDDSRGAPIFAGVNGAEFGSDKVEFTLLDEHKSAVVRFSNDGYFYYDTDASPDTKILTSVTVSNLRVIGSQWEERLKDNR